MNPEKE